MIMTSEQIIADLKLHAHTQAIEWMARFGIRPAQALGVSIPSLRKMAKEIGRNHALALALWDSGIHEARILASMIDEPQIVSAQQMEEWVNDFDSWDVCDQVCGNLFDKTPDAYQKAVQWCQQEKELVRRAGFVIRCGRKFLFKATSSNQRDRREKIRRTRSYVRHDAMLRLLRHRLSFDASRFLHPLCQAWR
jgi:3-methyladenine DNA glycosylase AlkD